MHTKTLNKYSHNHVFGQDRLRPAERRTLAIVLVTATMMVVEITAGIAYGSMALLADGLHMASHATALLISVLAYALARRLSGDSRLSFGTGKITSLGAFASAVLLAGFAFVMVMESVLRLVEPVEIRFDQALIVAVLGLVVNGGSAWLLASTPHSHDGHDHGHGHHHGHEHSHGEAAHHHDDNLRAAYLHVLADALTSVLAIIALLLAKYTQAVWLDPVIGILGAILVARWSYGLLKSTGKVLIDWQADPDDRDRVRAAIERDTDDRLSDLHIWRIGDGMHAAAVTIVSDEPLSPDDYRALIPDDLNIVHATIEIQRCTGH